MRLGTPRQAHAAWTPWLAKPHLERRADRANEAVEAKPSGRAEPEHRPSAAESAQRNRTAGPALDEVPVERTSAAGLEQRSTGVEHPERHRAPRITPVAGRSAGTAASAHVAAGPPGTDR